MQTLSSTNQTETETENQNKIQNYITGIKNETNNKNKKTKTKNPFTPTGAGATKASDLLVEWQRLDPTEYPGAGAEGLTADGLMDPLLAFAYDAVFAAAAAVHEADEEIRLQNGRNMSGISVDRYDFFFGSDKPGI